MNRLDVSGCLILGGGFCRHLQVVRVETLKGLLQESIEAWCLQFEVDPEGSQNYRLGLEIRGPVNRPVRRLASKHHAPPTARKPCPQA